MVVAESILTAREPVSAHHITGTSGFLLPSDACTTCSADCVMLSLHSAVKAMPCRVMRNMLTEEAVRDTRDRFRATLMDLYEQGYSHEDVAQICGLSIEEYFDYLAE